MLISFTPSVIRPKIRVKTLDVGELLYSHAPLYLCGSAARQIMMGETQSTNILREHLRGLCQCESQAHAGTSTWETAYENQCMGTSVWVPVHGCQCMGAVYGCNVWASVHGYSVWAPVHVCQYMGAVYACSVWLPVHRCQCVGTVHGCQFMGTSAWVQSMGTSAWVVYGCQCMGAST